MANPNFIILYVDNPPASGKFYQDLLGQPPAESAPTFVMFALPSGLMFGLWSRHTVEPAAIVPLGGGSEVCFAVDDKEQVAALYVAWTAKGLRVAQAPVDKEFGRTFVALDPDGHRLRVFAAAA